MKELKWKEAQKQVQSGTYFLEFFTDWCGDCKMMEPTVGKAEFLLNGDLGKDVTFIKVNAEEAKLFRETKTDLQVLKVPSFFKVVDGKFHHIGYEYLPLEKLTGSFK